MPLFVADHFDSDGGSGFVVVGFDDLPEGTLADHLQDLVSIAYVIVKHLMTTMMMMTMMMMMMIIMMMMMMMMMMMIIMMSKDGSGNKKPKGEG